MRANGAIEGGAAGFDVGDSVFVMKKYDNSVIKVVGHTDGVRACGELIFVSSGSFCFVWDLAKETFYDKAEYNDSTPSVPHYVTSWPVLAVDILNWTSNLTVETETGNIFVPEISGRSTVPETTHDPFYSDLGDIPPWSRSESATVPCVFPLLGLADDYHNWSYSVSAAFWPKPGGTQTKTQEYQVGASKDFIARNTGGFDSWQYTYNPCFIDMAGQRQWFYEVYKYKYNWEKSGWYINVDGIWPNYDLTEAYQSYDYNNYYIPYVDGAWITNIFTTSVSDHYWLIRGEGGSSGSEESSSVHRLSVYHASASWPIHRTFINIYTKRYLFTICAVGWLVDDGTIYSTTLSWEATAWASAIAVSNPASGDPVALLKAKGNIGALQTAVTDLLSAQVALNPYINSTLLAVVYKK